MNSTESRIGLLLEDAQTALERGVKRGAVKMDIQLEIRCGEFFCLRSRPGDPDITCPLVCGTC